MDGRDARRPRANNGVAQQPQAAAAVERDRSRSASGPASSSSTSPRRSPIESGRFVSGLRKEDFRVYQDDELQPITHFNSERVPVSLGIALDTSGSMDGEKMVAAREALNSFLEQLNDPDDEVFLYRFDNAPGAGGGWTRDKRRVSDGARRASSRAAARRCTTRSPRRCRSRSRGTTARRRS